VFFYSTSSFPLSPHLFSLSGCISLLHQLVFTMHSVTPSVPAACSRPASTRTAGVSHHRAPLHLLRAGLASVDPPHAGIVPTESSPTATGVHRRRVVIVFPHSARIWPHSTTIVRSNPVDEDHPQPHRVPHRGDLPPPWAASSARAVPSKFVRSAQLLCRGFKGRSKTEKGEREIG
jgi:hypothetical protein